MTDQIQNQIDDIAGEIVIFGDTTSTEIAIEVIRQIGVAEFIERVNRSASFIGGEREHARRVTDEQRA